MFFPKKFLYLKLYTNNENLLFSKFQHKITEKMCACSRENLKTTSWQGHNFVPECFKISKTAKECPQKIAIFEISTYNHGKTVCLKAPSCLGCLGYRSAPE